MKTWYQLAERGALGAKLPFADRRVVLHKNDEAVQSLKDYLDWAYISNTGTCMKSHTQAAPDGSCAFPGERI